jgi:hypothetical protein
MLKGRSMLTRSAVISSLLALAVTLPMVGCGDNSNNDNIFIGEDTPTPIRTPSPGVATITPGSTTPTVTVTTQGTGSEPTSTPTPTGGPACNSGDQIVAMASVDKPYGGLSIRLAYPAAANIPGSGTAQSVKDRVVFGHPGGLTAVNDLDANGGDGVDDTLAVSSVSSDENPAGLYVTATFDCLPGQPRPGASAFTCTVQSASMPDGTEITDESCTLVVQ